MMLTDENGDDSVSASICSQSECRKNPRQNWALGCLSEQLLNNLKLKTDALGYCLAVLHPRGQVDRRYCQIVWSSFPYPITFQGRGVANRKGGGGSQVKKISQRLTVPNHSIYQSRFRKLNWRKHSAFCKVSWIQMLKKVETSFFENIYQSELSFTKPPS